MVLRDPSGAARHVVRERIPGSRTPKWRGLTGDASDPSHAHTTRGASAYAIKYHPPVFRKESRHANLRPVITR